MAKRKIPYLSDAYESVRETLFPSHNGVHKVTQESEKAAHKAEKAIDRAQNRAMKTFEQVQHQAEKTLNKAQHQADKLLGRKQSQAEKRTGKMQKNLQKMQKNMQKMMRRRNERRIPWVAITVPLVLTGVLVWLFRRNPEAVRSKLRQVRGSMPLPGMGERQAIPVTGGLRGQVTGAGHRVQVFTVPTGHQTYQEMAGQAGMGFQQPQGGMQQPTPGGQMGVTTRQAPREQAQTQPARTQPTHTHQARELTNLEVVAGIGPKTAGVLKKNGINDLQALSEANPERLAQIMRDNNLHMANPSTWPAQARMALEGKWDDLEQLKNQIQDQQTDNTEE